jgi:2-dehydro-3-deoxyphosphooctonate aldolase (KDO 8-P synthase)
MMLDAFTLVAGPCQLEGHDLNLEIATDLARLSERLGVPVVFKASFDKANRSRLDSPRGPGLEAGLELLAKISDETGLPILTDIHENSQAAAAAQVADILQIPAFLCRQTDLLTAAGATGKVVNVKKGQWMSPGDMHGAVDKARSAGASQVALTERGSFFGYGDLVVDMRSFRRIQDACGVPVIFDGTHSVQRPGQSDGSSGGNPEFISALVLAAVAAGCDGLFLEAHPNPEQAPSDGHNMLPLKRLGPLIERALAVRGAVESAGGATSNPATA